MGKVRVYYSTGFSRLSTTIFTRARAIAYEMTFDHESDF